MKIKDILKKFVPATYSKIESANTELYKNIVRSTDKLQKVSKDMILESRRKTDKEFCKIYQKIEQIEQLQQSDKERFSAINERLDRLGQFVPQMKKEFAEQRVVINKVGHRFFYNNDYEREVIASFYEMYEREDFKEIFLRLIHGLEEEDIATISLILQRQRLAKESVGRDVDLFTPEEQEQILAVKRYLSNQIFQVAEDMYCYKHYLLPIRHFEASVFYYKHGIDCIENLSAIRNRDILDVGGYIGDSILVLKPLTDRHVISFEAVSKNFELMKRTVEMNRLPNVILEKMALGSRQCEVEIELAGSSSSLNPNEMIEVTGEEKVRMDTLDSYLEHSDLDLDVGLIKVDIEGAEQDFMAGARKTIEHFRPVLLMSIYHNADDFFNIKPIIESWNLGYRFRIHKPVDFSVSREVLLIAEVR